MNCPQCGCLMQNLGNISIISQSDNLSGMIYASNPPQWDDTYVCHTCKIKVNKREYAPNYSWLNDYKEV
jgi:hypothetical protein